MHYHHGSGGGWQTRIPLDLIHAHHSASESGSPPLEFKFALVNGPVHAHFITCLCVPIVGALLSLGVVAAPSDPTHQGDVWEGGPNRVLSADAVSAIENAEASGECTVMKLVWEEPDRILLTTVRPTPR